MLYKMLPKGEGGGEKLNAVMSQFFLSLGDHK